MHPYFNIALLLTMPLRTRLQCKIVVFDFLPAAVGLLRHRGFSIMFSNTSHDALKHQVPCVPPW